jgi:hypothetical protein
MKTLSNLLKLEHQMKHKKKVMKGMLMYRWKLPRTPKATINVSKCSIGSQKKDDYIYQENGQNTMQQKKLAVATLLTKFLKKKYSIIFQEPWTH